jgi:acyl carrier protein
MYRTGDYARLQASGVLIPVGRRDARGKIRGFRVDLQEVEAALRAQPGIDQAVALIEPHNRLVAYVVEDHTGAVTQKSLRRALAGLLPDYAVPARIFTVPSMPVLASGKVDRQALAAQSVADSRPGDESTSGEIDEHLLAIWERTLHYRGARLDDNFFEQGGDSLAAVALFLDIETELGVRLAPATLFDTANLGQLASLVREGGSGEEGGSAVLWRAGGSDQPPLFLVHTIAVHVPHLRKLVELLNQEIPVFALEPIRVTQAIGRQLNV